MRNIILFWPKSPEHYLRCPAELRLLGRKTRKRKMAISTPFQKWVPITTQLVTPRHSYDRWMGDLTILLQIQHGTQDACRQEETSQGPKSLQKFI